MTSHDNVTDIVERLGWHHEHPVTGALVLRNHDGPEAASTIATLRKQLENAREEAKELRHWAFNHVDAMLLYISYPEDSHVKEAVEFCKIIAPERKMRMNHLQGSGFHPAREALKGQPC